MNAIVYELTPQNIGSGEIIYNKGEDANSIYFILTGKIKLQIDLLEMISHPQLYQASLDLTQRKNQIALKNGEP